MPENHYNRNICHADQMKCAECTMLKAIENVKQKYAVIHRLSEKDNKPCKSTKKERELQTERSFAYELYHQWSLLLQKAPQSTDLHNYQLSGEVSKNLKIGSRDSYPDMVLHKNHDTTESQLIACEIKRSIKSNNPQIKQDLIKLHKYLHFTDYAGNDASFNLAVFIAANCSDKELRKKIKRLLKTTLKDVPDEDKAKIKFISAEYKSENNKPESTPIVKIFSLKDL